MKVTNIGKNILELRKSKKKTAEQMAEALRVTRQTVSKWEQGITVPNAYNVLDMASYLDVTVSDIYGQILADKIVKDAKNSSSADDLNEMLVNIYSDGLDEKKNIRESITAFDRCFKPFEIKVGFNSIKYEELLRRMSIGYVMGIKESEYPVEVQKLKSGDFIFPALVYYLIENGLLAFYYDLDGYKEDALFVILRDEYEVLRFKELIRIFFVGLVDFGNHKWMRELFANHSDEKRFEVATFVSDDIINNQASFDDKIMTLFSTNEKKNADFLLEKLLSLDKTILHELLENCHSDLLAFNDREDTEEFVTYAISSSEESSIRKTVRVKKEHDYNIYFYNSNNAGKNRDFEEVFLYYKSFDEKEDAEFEIDHILHLGDLGLKKLLEEYDYADGLVLFNNKSGERALYSISNPRSKSVSEPSYVYRPESIKLNLNVSNDNK